MISQDINNVYAFNFFEIANNKPFALDRYKGKVMLIVNTASQCGFTPQYAQLESLYQKYKGKGLVVIGVPSNDFGEQEPGSNNEIVNFCTLNYEVTFPMTSKELVVGDHAHPFYQWAYKKLGFGTGPKWNFHKYLINRKGELVDYFNSTTAPDSDRVIAAIEKLLDESV